MKSKTRIAFALILLVLLVIISNTTAFYSLDNTSSISLNKTIYASDNSPNISLNPKIHNDLKKKIRENPKEKIIMLFKATNENKLDSIETLISSAGGKVLSKNKIGDIIIAEMPAKDIEKIITDNSIESVWPDRIYQKHFQGDNKC